MQFGSELGLDSLLTLQLSRIKRIKKTQFLYEVYIIYEKLQKFTECSLESLHIICFEEKRKRLIYIIHSIMSTAFSFD